jgi:hypothetical protein
MKARRMMVPRVKVAAALAVAAIAVQADAGTPFAQRQSGGGGGRGSNAPIAPNIPYDGRFTFLRVRYGPPIAYQSQRVRWSHDYPEGEVNMMKILNEISSLGPHIEQSNILPLDDDELFKYPVAYMCEPGDWYVSEQQAANLRAYLQKGGFLIIDDFRRFHWDNFDTQIHRVLPYARIVDLDVSHPIFHSFFEINSLDEIPQYYDPGRPIFRGIFEDNDPKRRLVVAIAFNTDVSEFWEWSGTGFKPMDESNAAFKLGVNFFIYGLTH